MGDDAEALRAVALGYLEVLRSDRDLEQRHTTDPSMTTDLWYGRYCLETAQMVQTIAASRGLHCEVVCGLLVGPRIEGCYPRPWRHAWLELPDGTIVDPTSAQYELPACFIARPGDELYRHYRM